MTLVQIGVWVRAIAITECPPPGSAAAHEAGPAGVILANHPEGSPAGALYNVFLLADLSDGVSPLQEAVNQAGLTCQTGPELAPLEESPGPGGNGKTEAVIVDLNSISQAWARGIIDQCKNAKMPVLTAVPQDRPGPPTLDLRRRTWTSTVRVPPR